MERAQSVKASPSARTPESFCDRYNKADSAPFPAFPALTDLSTGGSGRIKSGGKWAWINIWATFCQPCLREMDTLAIWKDQLASEKIPIDLIFISVDEGTDVVKKYIARNRRFSTFPSFHAPESAALEAAIKPLGLGSLDSIPMHILIDPEGKVRCTRAGALNNDDYAVVKGIFRTN
jgi:thiol-disulfide isomerase/thioredoxin